MARKQFEYMEVGPTSPITHLNELGHEGWQIIHDDPWRIVLMREKDEVADREEAKARMKARG